MINGLNFKMPSQGDITKEHSKQILEATGFDMQVFAEIVDLQNSLNEKVDIAWIQKGFDWKLAMLLESGELLDSINWKWWKSGTTDWDNIEIELIDLFHFLLSKSIENKDTNIIANLLIAREVAIKDIPVAVAVADKDEILAKKIQSLMIDRFIPSLLNKNHMGALSAFIEIWYLIGRDAKDLFSFYKMKYVLNNFRQDNGYKTGEYIKIWNGQEDNVVAQELIIDIPNDSNFIKDLYTALEKRYSLLIKPKDKSLEDFLENDPKWSKFIEMVPKDSLEIMFSMSKEFQKYLEK